MPDRPIIIHVDGNPTKPTRAVKTRWFPVRSELTLFMQQRIDCQACRMMRLTAGRTITPVFHVRRYGNSLIITEADDLHRPGRYLAATYVNDDENGSNFRLRGSQDKDVDTSRFCAGQGTATLTSRSGRHALRVTGMAAGFTAHDGILIEAIEVDA